MAFFNSWIQSLLPLKVFSPRTLSATFTPVIFITVRLHEELKPLNKNVSRSHRARLILSACISCSWGIRPHARCPRRDDEWGRCRDKDTSFQNIEKERTFDKILCQLTYVALCAVNGLAECQRSHQMHLAELDYPEEESHQLPFYSLKRSLLWKGKNLHLLAASLLLLYSSPELSHLPCFLSLICLRLRVLTHLFYPAANYLTVAAANQIAWDRDADL